METARLVEVAVDVAGSAGARPYTYGLPASLADIRAGELVLVGYGRRQALGVVLGPVEDAPDGVEVRPVRARVRADGPLLPQLQVDLARWVAGHYLAPIATVIRSFLPPGTLERVELVARSPEPSPAHRPGDDASDVLRQVVAAGPDGVAVRSLTFDGSRASLLRQLHAAEESGLLVLDWVLRQQSAGPRLAQVASLTGEGRGTAERVAAGSAPGGRPLGPRQQAMLRDLLLAEPRPAADLAARHGRSALRGLVARGLAELVTVERPRRPLGERPPGDRGTIPADAALTSAQHTALQDIEASIAGRRHRAYLLDGTSGGGKTAVYARAVAAALRAGRGALILVPEVALAVPLVDRLRVDLGVEVAVLHGALGQGERADEWRRIRSGAVAVVVGTRSAVMAPIADPGIVIVDEEHEAAYKSDRTPRYHARDVALELGRLAGAPVVLGSATPDVVTMGRARRGQIVRFILPERPSGRPPRVDIVDLRAELQAGNRGMISGALAEALVALRADDGERAILVINRRGAATIVLCRDCGYVQVCPECERPLVYHAAAAALRCHHCGAVAPLARRCPACGSPRIRYLGGGTERLEREVCALLPGLRVARLDRDVVERRGAAVRILDAFRDGSVDVLVGTSLVAKGIDVPEVTLAAVVSADIALNLPDARAAERTYQLLVQTVGRAGRGARPGRAFIQTYQPDHPAISAAARGDAEAFYDSELAVREAFGAPPFGELVKLTVALEDRGAAEAEARRFAAELRERARRLAPASGPVPPGHPGEARAISVLGPVPAYVPRRAGRWRFHLILRGPSPVGLLGSEPGPPWSVDVDPESLL